MIYHALVAAPLGELPPWAQIAIGAGMLVLAGVLWVRRPRSR
jgi:hypothetical protein